MEEWCAVRFSSLVRAVFGPGGHLPVAGVPTWYVESWQAWRLILKKALPIQLHHQPGLCLQDSVSQIRLKTQIRP